MTIVDALKLATVAGIVGLMILNPAGVARAMQVVLGILGDMFRVVTGQPK